MTKKKTETEPDQQRVRVHCSKCEWSTQRVAGESLGKCNECGAKMRGPKPAGRPALPVRDKRVRVVAFVLPSTLKWLGDTAGPTAAEILDRAAGK